MACRQALRHQCMVTGRIDDSSGPKSLVSRRQDGDSDENL